MIQNLQNSFYSENNFSGMSENNYGQPVVVDSNVLIQEFREGRTLKSIAKRIKKHKSRMIIPESVLGEVEKITGNNPTIIMEKVYEYHKHPITFDKTNEIKNEAKRISKKYYECHDPDTLILATAKITGSALVSLDRDLLQTAKLEGVQAFLPRNFIRWW